MLLRLRHWLPELTTVAPTLDASVPLQGISYDWSKAPDIRLPLPDLTLFLDLSPEVAAQRGGFGNERYEKSDVQRAVREMFKRIGQDVGQDRWKVLDAGGTIEQVEGQIWSAVQEALRGPRGPVGKLWE